MEKRVVRCRNSGQGCTHAWELYGANTKTAFRGLSAPQNKWNKRQKQAVWNHHSRGCHFDENARKRDQKRHAHDKKMRELKKSKEETDLANENVLSSSSDADD